MASFWVAIKIGFFYKKTFPVPTKGISALLKFRNDTPEDVTMQHAEFRGIECSSSCYKIGMLLHFLMLRIGSAFCYTQWEIAGGDYAKKYAVTLLVFPGYSTGHMHVPKFSAEEWFCYRVMLSQHLNSWKFFLPMSFI